MSKSTETRPQLVVATGQTRDALLETIDDLRESARTSQDPSLEGIAEAAIDEVDPEERFRMATVAEAAGSLVEALDRAEVSAQGWQSESRVLRPAEHIWMGRVTEPPNVGFLFPGQGSQFPGMAARLPKRFPWARKLVERADAVVGSYEEEPISSYAMPEVDRDIDEDAYRRLERRLVPTQITQPAVCLASVLWCRRLARLGIEPSVVAGHSLGELTALHAAGLMDRRQLFELAALRGRSMAASGGDGTMAVLKCDANHARQLIEDIDGKIVVANINAPEQTVLSGEEAAIEAAVARALRDRVAAKTLAVSEAFHSSLVSDAAETIERDADLPAEPRQPEPLFISGVTGSAVERPIEASSYAARQVTAPVDFVAVSRSIARRADFLVEVGPGNLLVDLLEATVENPPPALPVESAADRTGEVERVVAEAFVRGVPVRLDRLYAGEG